MLLSANMNPRGFSLIEMMVAVAIFAVVMTMALGALLSMSETDRRAQTLKSVINNLNFSLDSMTRSIRTGRDYHCDVSQGTLTNPRDCIGTPADSFAYRPSQGGTYAYKLVSATDATSRALCGQATGSVGCIVRSTDGGANYYSITAPEVYIDTLRFYVRGNGGNDQPMVTILISGTVTISARQDSPFNLQASVTQRLYDR